MVTLALASNHATRDLIPVADVTNLGDFIVGTPGYGQLFRPYQISDASNYSSIFGNVDTTNGKIAQFQYGTALSPTLVVLDIAKAATKLNMPLTLKQTTGADPGSTYTALYAKSDSNLYYFPTGGAETRLAKYTETPVSILTTTGDMPYANGANSVTRLAIGTTNQGLYVSGGLPVWGASTKSTLTTTGDMPYASSANTLARLAIGSTNQTMLVVGGVPTWGASLQSLMTASGDLVFASSANTPARLAKSTDGFVLTLVSGLPSWQTNVLVVGTVNSRILNYAAATDVANGVSMVSASTFYDVNSDQSFTVSSASSIVDISVRGAVNITSASSLAQIASQIIVDNSTQYRLGGNLIPAANSYANALAGAGTVSITGLSAASHTVRVRGLCTNNATMYCRSSTFPEYEPLHIIVTERKI